jgi:hypothetical protein
MISLDQLSAVRNFYGNETHPKSLTLPMYFMYLVFKLLFYSEL